MNGARATVIGLGLVAPIALVIACGSRSGLPVPEVAPTLEAGVVVLPDGRVVPQTDARVDAPFDAPPQIDAAPIRDVNLSICADASATLVYVVTETNTLLRFDPPAAKFTEIGKLVCPDSRQPFSMAVDRRGIAYVLYATPPGGGGPTNPGNIFRVSIATSACVATSYVPNQSGFSTFGMGFSADDLGTGETLYVASDNSSGIGGGRLGAIDTTSLALSDIGPFVPPVSNGELTGTGDGRLFAFYSKNAAPGQTGLGSAIAQIDKSTGAVIAENALPTVEQGQAWAFGFWGGDFYLFTAPDANHSVVTRYRPTDHTATQIASWPELIVGAGVSTCAPQQ